MKKLMMKKIMMKKIMMIILMSTKLFGVDYTLPNIAGDAAQSIGLGIDGFQNSSNSIFNHSSQLSYTGHTSGSGFQTTLMNEYSYKNLSLSKRFGKHVIGIGTMALSVSGIPKTEEYVNPSFNEEEVRKVSDYNYHNQLLKLGYSRSLTDVFSIGGTLNYYSTTLESVIGKGVNSDLSLSYRKRKNTVSLTVKNIIPFLNVDYSGDGSGSENLPTQCSLGFKHQWNKNIGLYSGLSLPSFSKKNYLKSVGAMYQPSLLYNKIGFMAGYREYFALNKTIASTGIGLSLDLNFLNVSYAFEKSDFDLTNYNHFISFNFNYK